MKQFRPLSDESGAAAAEMALLVPLLVVLLFGAFETGHFVWTQHKLVEAVRDGARFASRLSIDQVCPEGSVMSDDTKDEIRLLTRTGQIGNPDAMSKVPGWTNAQVGVTPHCEAFVDTGIYTQLGKAGPIITVSATNVAYPSFFGKLGLVDLLAEPGEPVLLNTTSNAPVIGL